MMVLVALQTGIQPAVTRKCVAQAVSGRSLVIAEMAISMCLALALAPAGALWRWSAYESLPLAGPPAAMYALRSFFKQAAYRRCDGVTFNVVNQTKVVFCALAAWLLLGEGQSPQQCVALLCAVGAGVLLVAPARGTGTCGGVGSLMATGPSTEELRPELNIETGTNAEALEARGLSAKSGSVATTMLASGTMLALATAACSGIAAALSQAALHGTGRPSAVFNLELSIWGLPLVALSGSSAGGSRTSDAAQHWRDGWQLRTLAPVMLQAAGGLLVSAVVQQQGGVAMGLCTVAGIMVSALVDTLLTRRPPTPRQACAAILCAVSVTAHQIDMTPFLFGEDAEQSASWPAALAAAPPVEATGLSAAR